MGRVLRESTGLDEFDGDTDLVLTYPGDSVGGDGSTKLQIGRERFPSSPRLKARQFSSSLHVPAAFGAAAQHWSSD